MSNSYPEDSQLNIEIDENIAEGVYTNLAIINHSPSEFVIDFVNMMPGTPKSKVKSRVVMTPLNAKRLQRALTKNIAEFEKGTREEALDNDSISIPMNFGPTGKA